MKSYLRSVGKGKWQRLRWVHTTDTGFEKTILELLESIKDLEHAEFMRDSTDIIVCQEYFLMKEELRTQLYAILA